MDNNIIKIDYDNIDVEEIMNQIRENIKKRNYSPEELSSLNNKKDFGSSSASTFFELPKLEEYIAQNNSRWNIQKAGPIKSDKKLIGSIIVFVKKVIRKLSYWYIEFLVDQQTAFNASATNSINETVKFVKESQDIVSELNHKIQNLNIIVHKTIEENEKLTKKVESIEGERKQSKADIDYFLFESKFRGSRENIKESQKVYLDYFVNRKNILDIGCGRGEFVELLTENNTRVTGIDYDMDNVDYCVKKGLPVIYSEAVEYLDNCPDSSLDGIFMGQVIEHLKLNELISIVKLAIKKLKEGSYFIAETINPQSLIVYTESYFLDPTHVKMIHPLTMKIIAETEGFKDIELMYLSPVSDTHKIPKLEAIEKFENIDDFNSAIERINNLIYGCRDYALIARK